MKTLLSLALLMLVGVAQAQVPSFTVAPLSGPGPFTIAWNVPSGSLCQAAGMPDWTGPVAASGTKPVSPAVGAQNLTLVCTVPGVADKADLKLGWVPATANSDNTPYTNAKGYQIFYGPTAATMTQQVNVLDPALTKHTVADVGTGTWFAAIKSWNLADVTSDLSGTVSKALVDTPTTTTFNGTVAFTVTAPPKPKPPVLSIE